MQKQGRKLGRLRLGDERPRVTLEKRMPAAATEDATRSATDTDANGQGRPHTMHEHAHEEQHGPVVDGSAPAGLEHGGQA